MITNLISIVQSSNNKVPLNNKNAHTPLYHTTLNNILNDLNSSTPNTNSNCNVRDDNDNDEDNDNDKENDTELSFRELHRQFEEMKRSNVELQLDTVRRLKHFEFQRVTPKEDIIKRQDQHDIHRKEEIAKHEIPPTDVPRIPPKLPIPPIKRSKKSWPPNTCLIVADSTLNGLNEGKMSKNKKIVVRSFSGAVVNDFYNYLEPLMEKKPSKLIIHAGTNDTSSKNANEIFTELLQLRDYVKMRFNIDARISCPTLRGKDGHKFYLL